MRRYPNTLFKPTDPYYDETLDRLGSGYVRCAEGGGGFVGNRVGVPDLRSWRPGTDFFARRFYSVSSLTSSVVMFRMGNPSFCLNQTASVETIPCL